MADPVLMRIRVNIVSAQGIVMPIREDLEGQLQNLEQFAPNAEAVLADPLSELSRKRQLWLLGVSLICVVLSAKVVSLTEASLLGLKFTSTAQTEVLFVLKCICAYFIVVFGASVYQDIKRAHYKLLPNRVALVRAGLSLLDKSNNGLMAVTAGEERLAAIATEFTSIVERSKNGFSVTDRDRLAQLPILANAASEDIRKGTATLDAILNRVLDSHPVERRVRAIRLFVELASPVVLGFYALWLR